MISCNILSNNRKIIGDYLIIMADKFFSYFLFRLWMLLINKNRNFKRITKICVSTDSALFHNIINTRTKILIMCSKFWYRYPKRHTRIIWEAQVRINCSQDFCLHNAWTQVNDIQIFYLGAVILSRSITMISLAKIRKKNDYMR
jgi:hypothetical protein